MSIIISSHRGFAHVDLAARSRRRRTGEKHNKIRDVCAARRRAWQRAPAGVHIKQIAVSAALLDEFNSKP